MTHPAPYNPRRITPAAMAGLAQALYIFGDLSGLVLNRRTGNIVCGHQRTEAGGIDLEAVRWGEPYDCELGEEGKRFTSHERAGTVLVGGAPFAVREVSWPEAFERFANVTANNPEIQGSWDDKISDLIGQIKTDFPGSSNEVRIDELLKSIRRLATDLPVAGMEVVEVSPPYDSADITALLAHRVILEALSGIALRRSGRSAVREPSN